MQNHLLVLSLLQCIANQPLDQSCKDNVIHKWLNLLALIDKHPLNLILNVEEIYNREENCLHYTTPSISLVNYESAAPTNDANLRFTCLNQNLLDPSIPNPSNVACREFMEGKDTDSSSSSSKCSRSRRSTEGVKKKRHWCSLSNSVPYESCFEWTTRASSADALFHVHTTQTMALEIMSNKYFHRKRGRPKGPTRKQ